jgi:signal transduction histidine kinase
MMSVATPWDDEGERGSSMLVPRRIRERRRRRSRAAGASGSQVCALLDSGCVGRYGLPEGGPTSSHVTLHSARAARLRGFPFALLSWRYIAGVVAIAGAYYAFAQGGEALLLTGPAGAFWPATGLGIAVLYLGGLRWWPGVLLGDLLSREFGLLPLGTALAETGGNVARALVAVVILRRLVGPSAAMDRLRQVGAVLVAVAAGEAISATVAMVALRAGGVIEASDMSVFWRSWWLGGLAGGLVVVPLALAWARPLAPAWRGRGAWEGAAMVAAVVALSAIALSADEPLTYLLFPVFIWAALRFGPQGATLAVAVAVVSAVWAASNELGPFVEHSATASALNLQLYIALAALTTLCLAAIVSERRRAAVELAESRARIAAAGAEERRRLEGELHDRAQNRLVGLQIRLTLARDRAAETAPEVAATLTGLVADAEAVSEELRRIAHGISPQLLATRGVADALRAECAHSGVAVQIAAEDVGLSAPDVETAVYLCCLEAIQNAAKHGGRGASVAVRLRRQAAELEFIVHDTGRGFDPRDTARGAGLTGLQDRVETVGGRVEIAAAPGRGTTVAGVVPWPPRAP